MGRDSSDVFSLSDITGRKPDAMPDAMPDVVPDVVVPDSIPDEALTDAERPGSGSEDVLTGEPGREAASCAASGAERWVNSGAPCGQAGPGIAPNLAPDMAADMTDGASGDVSGAAGLPLSPPGLPAGMLSSSQIRSCLRQGLLLHGHDERNLTSATYDMRLGAEAFRYENERRVSFILGPQTDRNRGVERTLTFAPNSLTFVTTIEDFDLPADIIARFNLKSRWVHKGLLLGTAPIVDPQFRGKMMLPIHNFSSNLVQMDYGDALIAVEFTKTLPVGPGYVPNPEPAGKMLKFIDSAGKVESSVFQALAKNRAFYDSIQSKTRFFTIAGGMSLFLLVCANLSLLVNIFNLAENARRQADTSQTLIDAFGEKDRARIERVREELDSLKLELHKLRLESGPEKLANVQARVQRLEEQIAPRTVLAPPR